MSNNSFPSRRKFLQWATVIAYPSVPSMLLNACCAGGDGVGSILSDLMLTPTTPTTQTSEINPTSLTIMAKPVKAVYVPGKIPTSVNAWSFVNPAKVTATINTNSCFIFLLFFALPPLFSKAQSTQSFIFS